MQSADRTPQSYAVGEQPRFIPTLEGLRAVAALGIVVTHVSFQTGLDPAGNVGGVFARFDYFVALFFGLSAFLLWRRHRDDRSFTPYAVSRAGRILPAYLACVVLTMLAVPEAYAPGGARALATVTLTQLYLPDGLVLGLTHLWSLVVEVGFYAVLPLLAVTLGRLPRGWRLAGVVGLAALSLGWAFLPFVAGTPAPGVPNRQIYPPAYATWFAVGLLAAELEGRVHWRPLRWRPLWWTAALALAWLGSRPWFGPVGLQHPWPAAFARRIAVGAGFGACLLLPYAWAPGSRLLDHPALQALGRWSYGIFLWHLPVLSLVFPVLGVRPFTGRFLLVLAVTLLVSVVVAAASYTLVERPAAAWLKAAYRRREASAPKPSATASGTKSASPA